MRRWGSSTVAALLLLFALVSAALAAIVVPSVLRWTEDGQTIRANRDEVTTVRVAQQSFVRLKNASDDWSNFSRSRRAGFLEATTTEEALAAARAHVTTLVENNGGTLNKFEAAAGDVKRAQVETVVLSLDAYIPRDRIGPFLAVLEDAPPFTFVSSFKISQRNPEIVALKLDGQMERLMEQGL